MATQVARRRGTTAQHVTFTGALAELTVDTTLNTVVVHDGVTAGGHPLAKASDLPDMNDVLQTSDIGVSVQAYDATILKSADIGTSVQGYDADTAKLDVDQNWTGAQRSAATTDNDLSFDLAVSNNFVCTTSGNGTLTFTNIAGQSGQSGFILLVNASNHTISAHANTKVGTTTLTTISATGTYLLSYFSDGTNVYVVNSGALA